MVFLKHLPLSPFRIRTNFSLLKNLEQKVSETEMAKTKIIKRKKDFKCFLKKNLTLPSFALGGVGQRGANLSLLRLALRPAIPRSLYPLGKDQRALPLRGRLRLAP